MPASIGVNLRVTGHCRQGGRKYMEDFFSVAYQQTEDEKDLEYAFFGIYDGHGGAEAAAFAKEHLMESIVKHRGFWSDDDEEVLRSIKDGFMHTHLAMWKIHDKWPKTQSGLPSTAGTTASIAFIRRGKIYIGHVGDSGITLGYQEPGCSDWRAKALTNDHKPESETEMSRIEQCGGKVVSKSGVPRVVWNRPRIGHKGPVRRSTPIDEIPFLAVARSLGDLWSYNSALDEFVVSPTPDVDVIPIDPNTFRCLIFGTDGLYNMLSPHMAVHIVQQAEKHNEQAALSDSPNRIWINPSKCLVEKALERWSNTKMRADNTSVITLMLDPPGPPRAQVLRSKKNPYSSSGLQIETRYQEKEETKETDVHENKSGQKFLENVEHDAKPDININQTDISQIDRTLGDVDNKFIPKLRESTAFNTRPPDICDAKASNSPKPYKNENDIQINEVSSSSFDGADDDKCKTPQSARKNSKNEKVLRNLRSTSSKPLEEITSSLKPPVTRNSVSKSTSFDENSTETSDSRVLRERKNTPNDKSLVQKRKFAIRKKLNLSNEKKKILQSVLFRNHPNKDSNVKLNGRKMWSQRDVKLTTPTKSEDIIKTKENTTTSRISRQADRKTPEKKDTKLNTREIRKSTLAQKFLMHQEMFKAKLRGRSKHNKKLKRSNGMKRS